jgi:hypothetical protein
LSLPFTGLAPLWDSGVPTTPVLLVAAAGAAGLINAVIGDGKAEGAKNQVLRWSALLLSLCILPLAVIAAISMGVRIQQYGLTPDRIWGLLAVVVASVYGVAYLVAAVRSAKALLDWDDHIRPANVRIALGLCGVTLFLAMPILDFGAVSARDQLARLKSGLIKDGELDWRAMAFEFGPKGRATLAQLVQSGSADQKSSAKLALAATDEWQIAQEIPGPAYKVNAANFSFQPADKVLGEDSMYELVAGGQCAQPCRIVWTGNDTFILVGQTYENGFIETAAYMRNPESGTDQPKWRRAIEVQQASGDGADNGKTKRPGITPQSRIEIRTVERRQVYVDGRPVGSYLEE